MVKMHRSKLYRLVVAAWLCAAPACTKSDSSNQPAQGADKTAEKAASNAADRPAEKAPEQPAAKEPAAAAPAAAGLTYERSEGGVTTTLRVDKKGSELSFTITSKACDATITGVAKEKEGDAESRDDDKGEAHFVSEYVYEGDGCGASVSINADQSLAWVSAWDCKLMKAGCELTSGPLTRK